MEDLTESKYFFAELSQITSRFVSAKNLELGALQLKAVTLCIGVLISNFGKWKKQLRKGFTGLHHRKVAKRKFFCSNVKVISSLAYKSRPGSD